jgi:putative zinc finger/helix-turn-helix YgiT family protein
MATICPICGAGNLKTHNGKYTFEPPPNIPGGPIVIENAKWEECTACGERIASIELEQALERERYRRLGLLTPEEILQIRKSLCFTQTEMSQILDVGEKTYARWESGHSLQNMSSDNLIRIFYRDAGQFLRMKAERNPERRKLIEQYIEQLQQAKGQNQFAVAAHGGELSSAQQDAIHRQLKGVLKRRRKGNA